MGGHPVPPGASSPASGTDGTHGTHGGADSPPRLPIKPGGEQLPASERLLRRADYLRCYRTGRRRMGSLVILYFAQNQLGTPRVGITASRKVGNAVGRHRLKRWIKEIYRRWPGRGKLAAVDLVVHLKLEARSAGFDDLARDVRGLLAGLGRRGQQGERREPRA